MSKVIKADELPKDLTYEPPLRIEFGVNSYTCGAKRITNGRTVVPPGAKNTPHIHQNCEASMYVISGRMKVVSGPVEGPWKEEIVEAGHFCYVPQGEVHGIENLSQTEPVLLIFAYGGVPNKEAAGTMRVERPGATPRALAASS